MSYNNTPQQKRVFTGVMDQDSAAWEVAANNYRRAINLENNFVEGQSGSQTNLKGFTKVENPALPSGDNICIGSYEDIAGKSCIFFLYNSTGRHGIYRYYGETSALDTIYQVVYPTFYTSRNPDPLNFQKDVLIRGIDLVADLLYYTDGYNQPRCINIVRANNTGKRKEFNFYFNPVDNSTATKTYTLSLYARFMGVPVETFIWTSVAPATMASRVKDFIRNVQSNYFIIENKGDYAKVTMSSPGLFHFVLTNGTPYADTVSPENFYPDYEPDLAQNYEPLNWDAFNRIKKPPTCAPEGSYPHESQTYALNFTTPSNIATLTGFLFSYAWMGFNTPITDTYGVVTAGTWGVPFSAAPPYGTGFTWNNPNAYLTIPSSGTITINMVTSWMPTTSWNNGVSFFEIHLAKLPASPTTPPSPDYTLYTSIGTTQTVGVSVPLSVGKTITGTPGDQYGIYVVYTNIVQVSLSTITGTPLFPKPISNKIATKAFMFRSAYKYKDFEQSVMSDYSAIPLPLNISFEDSILVNYTDKLLSDITYASQITDVLLYCSDDGGTTWNQFKQLPQQDWITNGSTTYLFKDTEVKLAISTAYAIKQFDAVPLVSNGQAYIDQRIFDGGITEGYDSPQVSFTTNIYNNLVDAPYATLLPHPSHHTWRRGYKGYVGIVYYDDYGRKSGVCTCENSEVNIPLYSNAGYTNMAPAYTFVQLGITSEPPSWATSYKIVRTKDLSQTDYLLYIANTVTNDTVKNTSTINLDNLTTYLTNNPLAQTAFNFIAGDRCRFIANVSGVVQTSLIEGVITEVTTNTFTVQWNSTLSPFPSDGFVFEAYHPGAMVDTVTDLTYTSFYEVGECLAVEWGNFNGVYRKYHTSNARSPSQPVIVNQSYGPSPLNTITPATVNVEQGGVYLRLRDFTYLNGAGTQSLWITDANAYEFNATKYDGTGRPCVIDLLGQQVLGTAFRFSNQYVIGTTTNGLSSNEALNFDAFADVYGAITALKVLNDDVLRFIFSNSYMASIYVNQGIIRQTGAGGSLISLSQQVAGNSHIIKRAYGTTNPESLCIDERGFCYGWDQNIGSVWLSGNNEPEPVSSLLMRTPFKRFSNERKVLDQKSNHTPAVFDLYKQVYYITLNPLSPRATVYPKGTLILDDLNNSFGYPVVNISIPVNGLVLYNGVATSIYLNQIVTNGINGYGNGWSAVINDDGLVEVTAGGLLYNDFMITVTLTYGGGGIVKTYNALLHGGLDGTTDPSFNGITLAFSPNRKGWIQECSFLPEMYGRIGNQVISFKNGDLWLHDSSDTYNNFYDIQYGSSMQYVLNQDYPKVKVPLSVWYRGVGSWGSKLTVAPSDSYPTGMETEMIPSQFRLENNGYYASVLRNKLDPRFTDVQEAWVNGDSVTGATVDMELYCNNSTLARLESANTTYFYNENS